MLCEQVLGKLNEFDTTGKEIETVDIEWHEAFKRMIPFFPAVFIRTMSSMQMMKN